MSGKEKVISGNITDQIIGDAEMEDRKRRHKMTEFAEENDENVSPDARSPFKKVPRTSSNNKRRRPVRRSMPSVLNTSQGFGSPEKLWTHLCESDSQTSKIPESIKNHTEITQEMRVVLYDWIMCVCEELSLHRETFHLAIDYLDRYLCITGDSSDPNEKIGPTRLQLVGLTGLFIATKVEEIYPPKLKELVTFTSGACNVTQVQKMEEIMLSKLGWVGSVRMESYMTGVGWLGLYLQMMHKEENELNRSMESRASSSQEPDLNSSDIHFAEDDPFHIPIMARDDFVLLAGVLDLCTADVNYMKHSHSQLAAALVLLMYEPREHMERIIGYTYEELQATILFMEPYWKVMLDRPSPGTAFPDIHSVEVSLRHNIQTSIQDFKSHFNKAQEIQNSRNKILFSTTSQRR